MVYLYFALLLIFFYFFPYLLRKIAERQLISKCRQKKILVLTYDDGPGKFFTPRLLDLLGQYNAVATFFLLGCKAKENPEIINEIIKSGHEIGNHSQNHLNDWKNWPWKTIKDIREGFKSLHSFGVKNAPFRPPYGKISLPIWLMIKIRKTCLGWWSLDSGDSHDLLPCINDVVESIRNQGGGVILLHDCHREKPNATEREEFVFELTEALLQLASEKMWKIKPYSYLMCK